MELKSPITVYWDLAPLTPLDDSLLALCDDILECRPLMLQLYDPSLEFSEASSAVLERLKGKPVAVTLTIPYSSLLSLAGTELHVKELLVAFDKFDSLRNMVLLPETGYSFFVNRDNWRELPDVVSICRNNGVNRLVLPMQRLYNSEEPFMLSKAEQEVLEGALAANGGVDGIRLTIHDPFIWRAFNPGIAFPQAGCQAANTMIAISPDGRIYPCPALPVSLGNVGTVSLKDTIRSEAKKELRSLITSTPAACNNCEDVSVCKGGCRGRSLVVHGSFNDIDDACQ